MHPGITRRQFLGYCPAALVAAGGERHLEMRFVEQAAFRVPLPIPPVLSPVKVDEAGDHYEVVQQAATSEILPGVRTRIWGYNGLFPGPTIRARCGRPVFVTHTNHLSAPTVVHLHGGVTRPESDGFPTDVIAPGHARSYEYSNQGRAATLWYHDHAIGVAGRNLYMGLAGMYVLEDDTVANELLPRGEFDVPLILQDRAFTRDGEFDYDHQEHRGAKGAIVLVNGAPWPVLEVSARKYRVRVLNASNAMPVRLALDPPQPMVLIAADQGLLPAPVSSSAVDLTMAERAEVVVDFARYPVGTRVVLRNLRARGNLSRIMRFDVVRTAKDDSAVPLVLSDVERLRPDDAAHTRTFVFGGKPAWGVPPRVRWVINGESFVPERVDAEPRLGKTEIWRFVNRGFLGRTMLHPVHTHLAPFQVFRRNGREPSPQERGWKDTVAVDEGEEVEVIIRWTGYRGRYLLHCHNLEHEDHAMMARVDVI